MRQESVSPIMLALKQVSEGNPLLYLLPKPSLMSSDSVGQDFTKTHTEAPRQQERSANVDQNSRRRSALTHEQIAEIFSRIQAFDYHGTRIRVVEHGGQKWMVFADVCKALGYKNPNHQSKYLSIGEKCRLDIGLKNTFATCVSERGLHFFTLLANKTSATEFYNWAISVAVFTTQQ